MTILPRRYLFLATKRYSLPILRPMERFLREVTGSEVKWYATPARAPWPLGDERLASSAEVARYAPDVVLVPGNIVPHFWPGLKVQLFHGLGEEKRGHYRVTGFFDLYCTPGPAMTKQFLALSDKKRFFATAQTGWPKLDPLRFSLSPREARGELGLEPDRPLVLYAPTFSPRYTSAEALLPEVARLLTVPWRWTVKFHELMDRQTVASYRALAERGVTIVESDDILPWLEAADVLLTDTSSVAAEFLLLDRPIVTFRAVSRLDKGINLRSPSQLEEAITRCLEHPKELSDARKRHREELHPYTDGRSSMRVAEAIENLLQNNLHRRLPRKPLNLWRKFQMRRKVARWER